MKSGNEIRSACASLKNEGSSENVFIRKISIAAAMVMAIAFTAAIAAGFVSASLKNYTVADGSKKQSFTSYESLNAEQVLELSGLSLDSNDTMQLKQTSGSDYLLSITRNCEITLTADGESKTYIVPQSNVADALNCAGVSLGSEDIVSLSLTSPISEGLLIKIDRISYSTVTKTEEVDHKAYAALAEKNDNLDGSAVKEGQTGVVTHVYKNKLVNGKVEESELIEQKLDKVTGTPTTAATVSATTSAPATTVKTEAKTASNISGSVAYASSGKNVSCVSTLTPSKTILLDDSGAPISYSKKITGSATAYYDMYNTGLTASGVRPQPGYIAVDPREIPYGTKMYIRSTDGSCIYGYAIAADTGGFVYNSSTVADLFFNTREECYSFGRRNIEIYILD